MKVLVITSLFPNKLNPEHGRYNAELLQYLTKKNEIVVVCPISLTPPIYIARESISRPGITTHWIGELRKIPKQEVFNTIPVYYPQLFYLPKKISKMSLGIFLFFRLLPIVRELRKQNDFEIIHAFGEFPEGFAAFLFSKIFRLPVIISHRRTFTAGQPHESYLLRKLNSHIKNNVDINIILSNALNKNKISKVEVISPGVDLGKYHLTSKRKSRKLLDISLKKRVLLFRGNLTPNSGVNYLIDAMELIASTNADLELYIIGQGILKDAIKRKITKLNLEQCIFIKDNVEDHDIQQWLIAADLFISPNFTGDFPISVIEAFACGTPVIAYKTDLTAELIVDQNTGLLANPRDCHDLASKISTGLSIKWDKDILVRRARKFDINTTVQKIQKIYERL